MMHDRKLFAPVQVMLPPQERRTWRAAARRRRLTLSDFVRDAVRQELRRPNAVDLAGLTPVETPTAP